MINWYPGHMAKSLGELRSMISATDLVIELCDARIPYSGRNPNLRALIPQNKRHILILSKADLADKELTSLYLESINSGKYNADKSEENFVLQLDLRKKTALRILQNEILSLCKPILRKAEAQGRINRPLRLMVCGIPNCGKSTLVNLFCGKKSAAVKNIPGMTRKNGFLRSKDKRFVMLDTPGILQASLENKKVASSVAACAAIPDRLFSRLDLACDFLFILQGRYDHLILERYGEELDISNMKNKGDALAILDQIALSKALLIKEGLPDSKKAAEMLLNDFRSGRLGAITLDHKEILEA